MKVLKERCAVFTQKDGSEVIESEIQLSDAKDNYAFIYGRRTGEQQYFIVIGESIFGSSTMEEQPDPYVELRFETVEESADYFLYPYVQKADELMNLVGQETPHGRLMTRKLLGEYILGGIYNYFCELGIQEPDGQMKYANALWSFCGAEYTVTQESNFDFMDFDNEDEDVEQVPKMESYASLDDTAPSAYHDLFCEEDQIINEFMTANMFDYK